MGWFSFLAAKGSVRASKGMQECATGEVWLLKLNSRHYKTNLKNVPFPLLTLILTDLCKKDLYILPFFRLLPSSHINAPVLNCRDEERVLRQWLVIPGSMKSPIGLWWPICCKLPLLSWHRTKLHDWTGTAWREAGMRLFVTQISQNRCYEGGFGLFCIGKLTLNYNLSDWYKLYASVNFFKLM